jgi:hypothetical protein
MERPPYCKKNTNGWTRLPQELKSSPTLFREALVVDFSRRKYKLYLAPIHG